MKHHPLTKNIGRFAIAFAFLGLSSCGEPSAPVRPDLGRFKHAEVEENSAEKAGDLPTNPQVSSTLAPTPSPPASSTPTAAAPWTPSTPAIPASPTNLLASPTNLLASATGLLGSAFNTATGLISNLFSLPTSLLGGVSPGNGP